MLNRYKELVDGWLQEDIESFAHRTRLRDGVAYALTNGGKRFRPAICLMVAEALKGGGGSREAALAIECLHCASLVADDLPCMDDDEERRNRPSVHKVFGESMALLVSYALIAEGYRYIARAGTECVEALDASAYQLCHIALENATVNSGLRGATGGQFLDMFPEETTEEALREVISRKTISLFEISFVFGWLFGGGSIDQLDGVKRAAAHFGMAFQVADDLGDVLQDQMQNKCVNYAVAMGVQRALRVVNEELESYRETLVELEIDTEELLGLGSLVAQRARQHASLQIAN